MVFTTFDTADIENKHAISLIGNNLFEFKNVDVPFEEAHLLFNGRFCLSRPIIKSIKAYRDASGLEHLYNNDAKYVIIDLDDIHKLSHKERIIEYFKNNNYRVNIFKSASHNGRIKFNMKVIVCVDFSTTRDNIDAVFNKLTEDLSGLCKVDLSASNNASYQAPSLRKDPSLFINSEGTPIPFSHILSYMPKPKEQIPVELNSEVKEWFFNHFIVEYGMTYKSTKNYNGTIQCSLPSEVKSKFGYYWDENYPFLLQHPQRSKVINAYPAFMKSDVGKRHIKESNIAKFKEYFTLTGAYKQNERFFVITDAIKDTINDFDNDIFDVLMIKGGMGTGKSTVIQEVLKTHKSRVLFISVRKSLSYDIMEKYNVKHYIDDFNNHEDTRYRIGDSLVIQVDSLHKIDINNFDLVIMDEFESLCLYIQQNMSNSPYYIGNMRSLNQLFSNKKIIVLDAFLNTFDKELYFKERKVKSIINEYKDKTQVYVYDNKTTFIAMIEEVSKNKKEGEIITCSFGTLNELYSVKTALEKHNLKVVSITSDTTTEAKKILGKLMSDKDNKKYDVLLFSPSITVGISILNNIKHHFHYDLGTTIDPVSSVQMTKRSRTAEFIHVYIQGRSTSQKHYNVDILNEITRNNIEKYLNNSANAIFYNVDTGDISNIGKFINAFVAHKNFYSNDHKEAFLFLLGTQFEKIINIKEKIDKGVVIKRHKKNLSYPEVIDMSDYSEIMYKQDKTAQDVLLMELLEIKRDFYEVKDEDIIIIHKRKLYDKLKRIKLYLFTTIEEKEQHIERYVLENVKDVLNHNREHLESVNTMIALQKENFSLAEFYKQSELTDSEKIKFLLSVGYKYKNKVFRLDKDIRRLLCL